MTNNTPRINQETGADKRKPKTTQSNQPTTNVSKQPSTNEQQLNNQQPTAINQHPKITMHEQQTTTKNTNIEKSTSNYQQVQTTNNKQARNTRWVVSTTLELKSTENKHETETTIISGKIVSTRTQSIDRKRMWRTRSPTHDFFFFSHFSSAENKK